VIELGSAGLLGSVSHVLCLGAHSDDIEIGCGGTLIRLASMNPTLRITWMVFTANGPREAEALASARRLLEGSTGLDARVEQFREGYFPYVGAAVKEVFDLLGRQVSPDVVFTHFGADRHQDHRLVSELTWNTFRDHLIMEYEIPKYDADLGSPNVFVQLDREICERKVAHLLQAFPTQLDKPWFSEETFWATLRLRGVECRSVTGYAEGFHCRKLVIA
jgi:LmbE family N-acetylglucosaminyl deacetylase